MEQEQVEKISGHTQKVHVHWDSAVGIGVLGGISQFPPCQSEKWPDKQQVWLASDPGSLGQADHLLCVTKEGRIDRCVSRQESKSAPG